MLNDSCKNQIYLDYRADILAIKNYERMQGNGLLGVFSVKNSVDIKGNPGGVKQCYNNYVTRRKLITHNISVKIYRMKKELEGDSIGRILIVQFKGQVLTYGQIYQNVWGNEAIGRENNAVKCHIKNLREKLFKAMLDADFSIRCVREVGYCLDVNPRK